MQIKVFLATPYPENQNDAAKYEKICEIATKNNAEILTSSTEDYKKILTPLEMHSLKPKEQIHYDSILKAIGWADVMVFETTKEDFKLGQLAIISANRRKQTLLLSQNSNFYTSDQNKYLTYETYSDENLEKIIKDFLIRNRAELKSERFNFFLSKSQITHLEIAGKRHSMNKSEYLRKLIEDDISKDN